MPSQAPARARRPGHVGGDVAREAVEVRCPAEGAGAPTQFLWRGGLWLVRDAQPDRSQVPSDQCWRVLAGQGPGRLPQTFRLEREPAGRWWLQPVST